MWTFSDVSVVQAPMAGGPSTPELAAAVATAGGYGFVAGGYLRATQLADAITAARTLSSAPFGVKLFVPSRPSDPADVAAYASALVPEAQRLGVELGDGRWEDDAYPEKLDVVCDAAVHSVSFTFGSPKDDVVDALHRAGSLVAVTVTSALEARAAGGADYLIVQGTEAGGHQGTFLSTAANSVPLAALVDEVRNVTRLPLVAGGGVMTGADAAAAFTAGASAVVLGTALLLAPEAGTSATHRRALVSARFDETVVTRAYTGRFGRGLANRFALEFGELAPAAYPEVHHLTRPLRAAASAAGNPEVPNLWAGTGWRLATAEPAATIVARIAGDARRP